MDMVEKTRRSLTVLRRCQEADREELNYWIRRYSDAEDLKKTSSSSSSQSRQQSPASQESNALGNTYSAQDVCLYHPESIISYSIDLVSCLDDNIMIYQLFWLGKIEFIVNEVSFVFFFTDIHRELLHRPVSGYVPEEIWKKAG